MSTTEISLEAFQGSLSENEADRMAKVPSARQLFRTIKGSLSHFIVEIEAGRPPVLILEDRLDSNLKQLLNKPDVREFLIQAMDFSLRKLHYGRHLRGVATNSDSAFPCADTYYRTADHEVYEALNSAHPIIFFVSKDERRIEACINRWLESSVNNEGKDIHVISQSAADSSFLQETLNSSRPGQDQSEAVSAREEIVYGTFPDPMFNYHNTEQAKRVYGQINLTIPLQMIMSTYDASREVDGDIFVFKDIHSQFEGVRLNPVFIRALRECYYHILERQRHIRIILIAPDAPLPADLEQEVHVVDVHPPSRNDIMSIGRDFLLEAERIRDERGLFIDPKIVEGKEAFVERIADAAVGLSELEIRRILDGALHVEGRLSIDLPKHLVRSKQDVIRKSGVLEYISRSQLPTIEVGGLDQFHDWLAKRRNVFRDRNKAERIGLTDLPKGVLLLGISGCGKSLSAKVIAKDWDLPLVRLDVGAIHGKYVGESEARMRRALKVSEAVAPCVLWIDEIEKGFGAGAHQSGSEVNQRLLSTFLVWLQERTAPVFTVATANDITKLPPEMLRAGRFDNRFFVGCPDASARAQIFEIHLNKRGQEVKTFNLKELAEVTHGFSGAEIEQAIVDGLYDAFHEGGMLTDAHVLENANRIRPLIATLGGQMEEIWKLLDHGQVESASEQTLKRTDVELIINPEKYFSMYCRLECIQGLEKEARDAERWLYADTTDDVKIVLIGLGDPNNPTWVYGQCNFKMDGKDEYCFKFCDRVEVIENNDWLRNVINEHDVQQVIVTSRGLYDRISGTPVTKGHQSLFKMPASVEH